MMKTKLPLLLLLLFIFIESHSQQESCKLLMDKVMNQSYDEAIDLVNNSSTHNLNCYVDKNNIQYIGNY